MSVYSYIVTNEWKEEEKKEPWEHFYFQQTLDYGSNGNTGINGDFGDSKKFVIEARQSPRRHKSNGVGYTGSSDERCEGWR